MPKCFHREPYTGDGRLTGACDTPPVNCHYRKPTASPQLAAVLGAVLSKGLNGLVVFLSLFSKCSQRGCVSGSIFAFGVVQFLIGRLATIRKTDWIR